MLRLHTDFEAESVYSQILRTKAEPILFQNSEWFILFAKRPCNEGHLLIVPLMQVSHFYLLPGQLLQNGFDIATQISVLLNEIYRPPRVALFIKGFTSGDHAHIHVTPAYASEDLDKDLMRPELSVSQMEILAQTLAPQIQASLVNWL